MQAGFLRRPMVALGLALLVGVALVAFSCRGELLAMVGRRLARRELAKAWKAAYTELHREVPAGGPRIGWRFERMQSIADPVLGWRFLEVHVPGLLDVDAAGMEHFQSGIPGARRLLILGGSTAFASLPSAIDRTYFHRLGELLREGGAATDITVFAAGAWKSEQELCALQHGGLATNPDVVLFLNGLNDLTAGPTAAERYDVRAAYRHEGDLDERVRLYALHMQEAARIVRAAGLTVVFAPQPAIFEKRLPSAIEIARRDSLTRYIGPLAGFTASYAAMRSAVAALADEPGVHAIDLGDVFDAEPATVFVDWWHLADHGHELLARALARELLPILQAALPR